MKTIIKDNKFEDNSLLPVGIRRHNLYAVQAVEQLEKLKSENKPWEAIELMVKIWADSNPEEYKSFLIDLRDTKETLYDKKFGRARESKNSLRRTLDIPELVVNMIRKLYTPEELPMNKKFFRQWAKRFPKMVIAERI